jgi:hypothetical protein
MTLYFIFSTLFIFNNNLFAVDRFDKEQIQFTLIESDGQKMACSHELLSNKSPAPAPPWWVVTCGDRQYTTDVWMDVRQQPNRHTYTLMFHLKESVSSSGEKRVRFNTHQTSMSFPTSQRPLTMSSFLDARNGLADLYVEASIPTAPHN